MIKMFIGNEEVVSNHEFSIKEEMLSASSTILNNCYPKSWELTKDYVSNFYYPKDYSKYVLASGGFEYGDTEYSILDVSGNQPQFESNVEKEWNSLNIYGKTEQETAPEEWGKNFLYLGDLSTEPPSLTITKLSNSSIQINGTATGDTTLEYSLLYDKKLDNNNYTFSTRVDVPLDSDINVGLTGMIEFNSMSLSRGIINKYETSNANNGKILTKLLINIPRNTVFNNTVLQFQLEQGTSMTSFTPATYISGMPSPYKISELNSVGYENLLYAPDYSGTDRGITTTIQNGIINCVGTTTSSYYNLCGYTNLKLPIGTYTLSIDKPLTHGLKIRFRNANLTAQTFVISAGSKSVTFTTTDEKIQYYLFAENGLTTGTQINETIYLQLQEGTQAHTYIPYGKYGIEVKTTGKNLININGTIVKRENASYSNISTSNNTLSYNITTNVAGYLGFVIPIEIGKKYTLSFIKTSGAIYTIELDNMITQVGTNYGSPRTSGYSFTATKSYIGIWVMANTDGGSYANVSNLMLEKGNTVTDYEPYKENTQLYQLDNPLRSIGDTKDLLYIRNNTLYVDRKIGKLILKGTENWQVSNTGTPNYIYYAYISNFKPKTTGGYSDHYKFISIGGSDTNQGIFAVPDYVRIRYGAEQSIASFKSWLTANNVELDYLLTTPYTEEIGQVQIPYSFEGINNVFLNIGAVDTIIDIYYYWKNYNVIFAGIVKNSGDISLNPRHPHYCSLQILDYKTFLSESDTLDYVISNKTIREAIEMVVDTVSDYGFSVGMIDISSADDVIGAYSTLNKTAYDVLQYLADISGSRWRARYIDNSSMAIDFYEPDTLPQADDIEYTQEYWENNNIVDLTFNYGTRDYRNKQIVLSDEVYAGIDYNEIILSNGYNTNFITSQNVGIVKEIIVNGVKKDVITQQEKDLGADADFYYTPGKNIIESSSSYTAGTPIAVVYTPLVKGRQIVFNNDEVGRIATQTDTIGVISRYESRNDVVSSAELERIGETYIEYKGKAEIILTLTTHNKDLFNIGEATYFNSPIDELKQKYMVKSKETQYIIESETGAINLFYVYELTSSFNSEKAINYFDNQRNKAQGNIQEGESITRNIDINSSAVIVWGNSSIEETTISVVGDNVLNSVLNSPFIE